MNLSELARRIVLVSGPMFGGRPYSAIEEKVESELAEALKPLLDAAEEFKKAVPYSGSWRKSWDALERQLTQWRGR